MFNQLTPTEVVTAIGTTLRGAARRDGPTSAYERDQLMSAYSATRHLAVALASYDPELRDFTEAASTRVRRSELARTRKEFPAIADRLDGARQPGALGATLCELFEILRRDPSPEAETMRSELHVQLRRLADREVDLLADALG